ncbi:hypothetical protein, partial [Chitinophaga sp. GbtcB8]|uniref:hypothetical protein n=1 Tax=Chitinophaga sp. GbtcB8 TaxID=2824753 RepID=UPI001C30EFD8
RTFFLFSMVVSFKMGLEFLHVRRQYLHQPATETNKFLILSQAVGGLSFQCGLPLSFGGWGRFFFGSPSRQGPLQQP